MRYFCLASGSKGNACVIESNGYLLQIDMGISKRQEAKDLENWGLHFEDISTVLITHNHSDHIRYIDAFEQKKVYFSNGTLPLEKEDLTSGNYSSFLRKTYFDDHILTPYQSYQFGPFTCTTLATSHDAPNPMGFVLDDGVEKLVYMTDTGYISERNMSYMKNADYYIIESNHDVRMLFATNRPQALIMRILGDEGHLSNEDAAMYLSMLIGPKTKEIVLAHLSEEANSEEKALDSFKKVLSKRHIHFQNIDIKAANQRIPVQGGTKVSL